MVDTTSAAQNNTDSEPPFIVELADKAMDDFERHPRVAAELDAWRGEFDLDFAFDPQFRERGASAHPGREDWADLKSINRFFEARLLACAGAQSRGGLRGLMPFMPSRGASEEEPFPCSHPRRPAACFSPWSRSP